MVNGNVHISGDIITSLFSAGTRGATPRNNWLLEGLYDFVAYVRYIFVPRMLLGPELLTDRDSSVALVGGEAS